MVIKLVFIFLTIGPLIGWSTSLDEKARLLGFRIGTAFVSDWGSDRDAASVAQAQFGFLTPTAAQDWDGSDDWQTWVANASAWKLPFRGPRLAGGKTPPQLDGLDSKGLDREFLTRVKALRMVTPEGILCWDAAANVFTGAGGRISNVFSRLWGPDWPARALALVRSVDPKTPLFLAEDDALALNPRSDALYRLAADLKVRGLPLAGVALGSRQRLAFRPDPLLIGANLKRFSDLGLEIHLYDVDFGLEPGELLKGRGGASIQSLAYDALFQWVLAIPAVKLVALAEPTDQQIRPWPSGWTPTSASLFTSSGVPKDTALSVGQILSGPRSRIEDLAGPTARVDSIPLVGMEGPGLPKAWAGDDVWDLVPETSGTTSPPPTHRAEFYLNPPANAPKPYSDELSLLWSISWTGHQLVFQADRNEREIQIGNRGSSLSIEIRGPGFSALWDGIVGVDGGQIGVNGTWSLGGRKVRVVFDVPSDLGWGPGTTFFLRLSTVNVDGFHHQGVTLYPWPGTKDFLPFERLQIVKATY